MCVLLLFLVRHILQHQALLNKCVIHPGVIVCVCVGVWVLTFLARFHMDNLIHIDSAHKKVRAWPAAQRFSPQHFQMKTHQRRNIWISWRVEEIAVELRLVFQDSGKLMGARLTRFCQNYLRYSRGEKDAFSRWDKVRSYDIRPGS